MPKAKRITQGERKRLESIRRKAKIALGKFNDNRSQYPNLVPLTDQDMDELFLIGIIERLIMELDYV